MYSYCSSLVSLVSILFTILILIPFISFAQEANGEPPVTPIITKGVLIASVNLSEAKIITQTLDSLEIEFVIDNQSDAPQFDVRYGAELIQNGENGQQTIFDSFNNDEVLTLSANQKVKRIISYPLTLVAPGTYSVWVSAKTTGGTMLGLVNAGSFTIIKSDSVGIKTDSCVLRVGGEDSTYSLYQGVDVSENETLTLDCVIKNYSASDLDIIPQFKTYQRTVFGEEVKISYPTQEPIILSAYQEKNITIDIPKASEAQAYDTTLNFLNEKTNSIISNRVVAHYVLQGASATIQTIALDKSYYKKGEDISLTIFWTPSADSFNDSRSGTGTKFEGNINAFVQVSDENNNLCSEKALQILDKEMVTIKFTATGDCYKPIAKVLLIGPDGATLDSRSVKVTESDVKQALNEGLGPQKVDKATDGLISLTITAFAIIFTTILFLVFRKKKPSNLA